MTDTTQPPAETLAGHFATGCWRQPDGHYAGECACGASFWGDTYQAAKVAWAEHALTRRAGGDAGAGFVDRVCEVLRKEQDRLDAEGGDYLMDTSDCINVIRENAAALALPAPVVEGKLEQALLVFAACARDLGPDVPDDEWAKFRLLASDYRRAHAAYVALTGAEPPFPEDAHAALSEGRSHG